MSTGMRSPKSRRKRNPNPKTASLSSESIVPLLTSGPIKLSCEYLGEPELVFSDKRHCEDPRTGLTAFGPYSKTDVTRRTVIRVGIVGPADAIDRALALLKQMSQPIAQTDKVDAMLHPSFPDSTSGNLFKSRWSRRNFGIGHFEYPMSRRSRRIQTSRFECNCSLTPLSKKSVH